MFPIVSKMIIRPDSFEKQFCGTWDFRSYKTRSSGASGLKIFYMRYIIASSLARSFIYYTDKLSAKLFGQI